MYRTKISLILIIGQLAILLLVHSNSVKGAELKIAYPMDDFDAPGVLYVDLPSYILVRQDWLKALVESFCSVSWHIYSQFKDEKAHCSKEHQKILQESERKCG